MTVPWSRRRLLQSLAGGAAVAGRSWGGEAVAPLGQSGCRDEYFPPARPARILATPASAARALSPNPYDTDRRN